MTREEAKEYASFLNAFAEGKEVQHAFKDKWVSFDEQDIDNIFDYLLSFVRIKPEPKYRPYTPQEILDFIEYQMRKTEDYPSFIDVSESREYYLLGVNNKNVICTDEGFEYRVIELSSFLSGWYIWKDGSPCGVEVKE